LLSYPLDVRLFPWCKGDGREIGHSHLCDVEIKKCEKEHFYFALPRYGVVLN